jgi:predicted metal-dependent hydrolase
LLAINLNLIATWCGFTDQKEYALRAQRICHYRASSLLPEFLSMTLRALLYRRPTEPQAIEVVCDGAVHLVRLRRHRQARRYTLRVVAVTREAVLTMPPRGSFREAREFAERHGAWIAARLDRLPRPAPFEHGSDMPLRGVVHAIVHRRSARGTVWTETDRDGRRLLCVSGHAAHVARRVTDYLKREAKRDLEAAVSRYADRLGVKVRRISIRDQVSRWGSCSTSGALSFSWRLVLAPRFVLDYLAAHEVAHLVEMNHSVRFWRLLGRICPDMERAKTWLDVRGTDLHRYGMARDGFGAAKPRRRALPPPYAAPRAAEGRVGAQRLKRGAYRAK